MTESGPKMGAVRFWAIRVKPAFLQAVCSSCERLPFGRMSKPERGLGIPRASSRSRTAATSNEPLWRFPALTSAKEA